MEYAPRYRLDRPEGVVPRVSLCVICKNEAHNLRDCVAPVADLVGDIVVVDTGSTDGALTASREDIPDGNAAPGSGGRAFDQ